VIIRRRSSPSVVFLRMEIWNRIKRVTFVMLSDKSYKIHSKKKNHGEEV